MKSIVNKTLYSLGGAFNFIGKEIGHLYELVKYVWRTFTGTNITINNTIEAKMRSKLSPSEMTQETTTGTNQIGLQNLSETTRNGLTFSINNGILSVNGTASAKVDFQQMLFNLTQNTSKTLKFYLDSGTFTAGAIGIHLNEDINTQVSFIQINYNTTDLKSTKTIDLTDVNEVYVYAISGSIFSNAKFRVMLSDNASDTYEPYTGGNPAPNPQYPQDIHTTTGDNVIRDEGKNKINLLNFVPSTSATTLSLLPTGINIKNTSNGYGANIIINNLIANTNYYLSYTYTNISNSINKVSVYAGTTASTLIINKDNGNGFTFNTGNNTSINIWFYNQANAIAEANYTDIQLELGTSKSSYIGYQTSQSYPLTLGTLEYSKIGNYEDEFIYNTTDTNLELNKWYLKKNTIKVVLDGTIISGYNSGNNWCYITFSALGITGSQDMTLLSNYFTNYTFSEMATDSQLNGICAGSTYIVLRKNDLASTTDYANWLSTHNTIVELPLANPEYLPLNDTLQEQLTNIYNNMMSKKTQTNISQVNDDLPMVITASALLDLNTLLSS